jgi:hypothetical protein
MEREVDDQKEQHRGRQKGAKTSEHGESLSDSKLIAQTSLIAG